MKVRVLAALPLVLLSCASQESAPPAGPAVAAPQDALSGPRRVLAERVVTFAGVPLTVRLCALDADASRQVVEVEARPRRLDWELYAEAERVGASTVVLVKLFEPGPGNPVVPSDEPLRTEVALDEPVSQLPVRVTHWLLGAHYGPGVRTVWVDAGTLVVADAAGRPR